MPAKGAGKGGAKGAGKGGAKGAAKGGAKGAAKGKGKGAPQAAPAPPAPEPNIVMGTLFRQQHFSNKTMQFLRP